MKRLASVGFLLVLALASAAQNRPVQLLSEASAHGENILLSDLLPPDANAQLCARAGQTTLGRSPQPGSFRVFSREQLQRKIGSQFELNIPEQVIVRRLDQGRTSELQPSLRQRQNALPLVEPHVPASLVIADDAIRIQMRVLPLGKAALGETVRVLDPVSHRVLVAQVAGQGLLRLRAKDGSAKGTQR